MRARGTGGLPRLLVVGDPRHGVTRYAGQLRDAVGEVVGGRTTEAAERAGAVHVHFTDRLFGPDPASAAATLEGLAARHDLTVTLHDLPQGSDGTQHQARRRAYARVVRVARAVMVNSEHERGLLQAVLGPGAVAAATVVPLPVPQTVAVPGARPGTGRGTLDAAVLGFFYPGKGHDAVLDALIELAAGGRSARLTVLGAASAGHEAELADLVDRAVARGVAVEVTGYLSDAELARRSLCAGIPVVAHQHVSASGSLNSWVAAGRRPLVRDSGYAREMDALRPGTLLRYPDGGLADALDAATRDPASTWWGCEAELGPRLADVAEAYVRWWRDEVPW